MGAFARIALRYGCTWALAKGWIAPEVSSMLSADPEVLGYVEAGMMAACVGVVEGWYWLAKKFGWAT